MNKQINIKMEIFYQFIEKMRKKLKTEQWKKETIKNGKLWKNMIEWKRLYKIKTIYKNKINIWNLKHWKKKEKKRIKLIISKY